MDDGFVTPATLDESRGRGTTVVVDKSQKRPPTAEGPAENANLVAFFTDAELTEIGETAWRRYVADVRSRAERMRKIRKFTEFYASIQKARSHPYQNVANVNLPIFTYPMLQVHARLYDMIWPENGKVLYASAANLADYARASATEKFANSYLRTEIPEMEQGLDDTLAQVCAFGSAFRRTYWDTYEGRVRSDWIPIEDFVVPDWNRCRDPSLRGVPRYTLVHWMTVPDIEIWADAGVFANASGLDSMDAEGEGADELKETKRRLDGTDESSDDDAQEKMRRVLEQHCRLRLPTSGKHPAFDGKWHYVIVTLDEPTRRVLRIVVREEDDPRDAKRFQREQAAYVQASMQHQAVLQQLQTFMTVADQQGREIPEEVFNTIPKAPEPPAPIRKREICFFTHYRAFYSEGFYGLGFGDFLVPLAEAGNTLLNQHLIGVTIKNAKPGFISRQLRGPRGSIDMQPGKLVEVDAPPEALDKGVKWMDAPLNDPTTMPLIQLILELGEKLAGSADLMSGATSGSNRTAKEIQILNAQLMKQISVFARRIKGAFKHELDKIWRCFGVFLPAEPEMTAVVDPATGQPDELPISRQMFIPDARVVPAADPRMRFERIDEANQKFGIVMNNPILAQNPMALYLATEDVLRANDGDRILSAVQPPRPPQPPPPPQPQMPWQEEASWLEGQDPPVLPQDDDQGHMQSHMAFMSSPNAQLMDKGARAKAEQHLRNHAAQAIRKQGSAMTGMPGPQMMPPAQPQGGPPPGPPQEPPGPQPGAAPGGGEPPAPHGGPAPQPPQGGPANG